MRNSLGVAIVIARPAGIHEDGFAGRSDDQSCRAALDVDPVDFEGLRRIDSGVLDSAGAAASGQPNTSEGQ